MRSVTTEWQGKTYHLLYNGRAMFAARDALGDQDIIAALTQPGAAGMQATVQAFCILAEQGELVRRMDGHARGSIPDADDVAARIMPDELIELQQAVVNAVMRGYHRDQPEEEIDLGLAELQKKKRNNRGAVSAHGYCVRPVQPGGA
ncbi:hypothetical protein B5F17_14310 [Butyricicoccus pullicaecorum]|uniref:Uncharacterized protein n=2 Tax=Butyricicoccus pullicaecorum TaxID=501571 RepID=A0A1Y4KYM0_9FIRM|nr:hypothetical protein B5F17_14310 [Butyricicoccus pullicaecorum]